MELRWLVNPDSGERKLQYRVRGDNGVYGPGYECFDTGWVTVPEVVEEIPTLTDQVQDIQNRPPECRERLRLEGKSYPKSGCRVKRCDVFTGCVYDKTGEKR